MCQIQRCRHTVSLPDVSETTMLSHSVSPLPARAAAFAMGSHPHPHPDQRGSASPSPHVRVLPCSPGRCSLVCRACWRGWRLQPLPTHSSHHAMSCPPCRCGCIRCEGLHCTFALSLPASMRAIRLPACAPFPRRVWRPSAVRRLAADSVTFEVRQWGLKVSWQRLVPLCCRLAFAAPVGVLGLCALCWAILLPAGAPFPFSPARAPARHRGHGAWAWGRGAPRLCAPRCGQAPNRRSAKPP
jgi:hypothetical protein